MSIPRWVNHLILKETSKISYINWILKVTSCSLFPIIHKGTSWDADTSKMDDMNASWNGSESRPCRSQSLLKCQEKNWGKKSCKLTENTNKFILLFRSYLFCVVLIFFLFCFVSLFIFFPFKFRKSCINKWRILKNLRTGKYFLFHIFKGIFCSVLFVFYVYYSWSNPFIDIILNTWSFLIC